MSSISSPSASAEPVSPKYKQPPVLFEKTQAMIRTIGLNDESSWRRVTSQNGGIVQETMYL